MSFSITCECGKVLSFTASQAGTTLFCYCGRQTTIPPLSTLRSESSACLFRRSAIEQVRALLVTDEIPLPDVCPLSGRIADAKVYFHVQCEQSWRRGREHDPIATFFLVFLLGWVGYLFFASRSKRTEIVGNDISIEIPMRIASSEVQQVNRMRQRMLKKLLSHVSPYRELLEEYPQALITPLESE